MQAFTEGKHASFYPIADVGKEEGLRELGVHSRRVPPLILPDECLPSESPRPQTGMGLLQRRGGRLQQQDQTRHDHG